MANPRKELAKQLRAVFSEPGVPQLSDYEPPESLVDEIDRYAGSSEIRQSYNLASGSTSGTGAGQHGGTSQAEKDTQKLREVLLEECWNEAVSREANAGFLPQIRSALIIVLERFAALDSPVVSPEQIQKVWWRRLLSYALLPESSASSSTHNDEIQLGRRASRAARDLVVKALCATESSASDAWRNEIFLLFITSRVDTFAQQNLQQILVAFGKIKTKAFFLTLDHLLTDSAVQALQLLTTFIRVCPVQAHQASQTPLIGRILLRLNSLDCSRQSASDASAGESTRDLVWVSLALTSLCMILPRIPTGIEKNLDTLFLSYIRTLLWHDAQFSHIPNSPTSPEEVVIPPEHESSHRTSASQQSDLLLQPLLDHFTTLYGLYPANFLAFLSSPVPWLRNVKRRLAHRRRAGHADTYLSPPRFEAQGGEHSSTSGGDVSTSAEEESTEDGDEPEEGLSEEAKAARVAMRRKAKANGSHGKGRRSKIKKQKNHAASSAKKDKEMIKQKEREKRRRGNTDVSGTDGEGEPASGEATPRDVARLALSQAAEAEASDAGGRARSGSNASSLRSQGSRSGGVQRKSQLAISADSTEAVDQASDGLQTAVPATHEEAQGDDEGETLSSSDESGQEETSELDEDVLKLDWEKAKRLSEPYISQHYLSAALLRSPEEELVRNKHRWKKLEVSDLTDEITRTRRPLLNFAASPSSPTFPMDRRGEESSPSAGVEHPSQLSSPARSTAVLSPLTSHSQHPLSASMIFSPSHSAQHASSSSSHSAAATSTMGDALPEQELIFLLQNQLGFEIYQKQQLVQRLGANLREHVTAGGAEADKQNLYNTVRLLRTQLKASQDMLQQTRTESALSRDRLNSYSQSQSTRLETLREERRAWLSESAGLKSRLEEGEASLVVLKERLAEREKKVFELEAEEADRLAKEEKRKAKEEEELINLRKQVEELKQRLSSKDGDASTKDADQAATSQANPNPAVQTEKSTEEAYEEQADGLEQ